MARTYRFDPNTGRTDHRDQKVGMVYSPRTAERSVKRSTRQAALQAAKVQATNPQEED